MTETGTTRTAKPVRKFADIDGRQWVAKVTYRTRCTILERTEADLLDTFKLDEANNFVSPIVQRMQEDPEFVLECVWACVEPAATADGISKAEWFDLLDDETIEDATLCFVEALTDFFRSKGEPYLKVAAATRTLTAKMRKARRQFATSTEVDQAIQEAMQKLASTPAITTF